MRNKETKPNIRGLTFYEESSDRVRMRKNIVNGDMEPSQTVKAARAS